MPERNDGVIPRELIKFEDGLVLDSRAKILLQTEVYLEDGIYQVALLFCHPEVSLGPIRLCLEGVLSLRAFCLRFSLDPNQLSSVSSFFGALNGAALSETFPELLGKEILYAIGGGFETPTGKLNFSTDSYSIHVELEVFNRRVGTTIPRGSQLARLFVCKDWKESKKSENND
ncbi:MAG TPA: hypothetical protein VFQ60_00400 [Patescibacteria group bacterium]|nr:hypothetical protein [Patescibacteria group bacterium]